MIHAVNERMAMTFQRRQGEMPAFLRPTVALTLLGGAALIAQFGLIGLIAQGYGTMTWVFLIVYVIPVLTLGVWRLWTDRAAGGAPGASPPVE